MHGEAVNMLKSPRPPDHCCHAALPSSLALRRVSPASRWRVRRGA